MRNQITFTHLTVIMTILIIPLILWGNSIETRFEDPPQNKLDIERNRGVIKDIQDQLTKKEKSDNDNFILVLEKLHSIELKVENKKDGTNRGRGGSR